MNENQVVNLDLLRCYSCSCLDVLDDAIKCYSATCPVNVGGPIIPKEAENLFAQFWADKESMSPDERKLSEAIFELVSTELDYVADLVTMQREILTLHQEIRKSLLSVSSAKVWKKGGFIYKAYLKNWENFKCYLQYGSNQMFAKDEFEREKASNPKFSDLIVKGESMKECRRLPFPSFLQRPVTRLGRYPLLLDAIMKRLTPSNPEFELADSMLKSIKDLLRDMNKETGIRSNAFKLKKLHENLDWNEKDKLKLLDVDRKYLLEGRLRKKLALEMREFFCVLLDNFLVICSKRKTDENLDVFRVFPISLLELRLEERPGSSAFRLVIPMKASNSENSVKSSEFQLYLYELAKKQPPLVLSCSNHSEHMSWCQQIAAATCSYQESFSKIAFNVTGMLTLQQENWGKISSIKLVEYKGKIMYLICHSNGLSTHDPETEKTSQILNLNRVTMAEYLVNFEIVLVLADGVLYSFSSFILRDYHADPMIEGEKISSKVEFFKVGTCCGKEYFAIMKLRNLESLIKVFDPAVKHETSRFSKLFRKKKSMKVCKEFYIGSEVTCIYFFPTKLCLGYKKGFELVDFETIQTQTLLDPTDVSLKSFIKSESVPKAIFKLHDKPLYLICYADFGFYINRMGKRDMGDTVHYWIGPANEFVMRDSLLYIYYDDAVEILHIDGQRLGLYPLGSSYLIDVNDGKRGLLFEGSVGKFFNLTHK